MKAIKRVWPGSLLVLLLVSGSGCYEPTEGCLDVRAANFAFDADDACSDCCEFPDLRIELLNRWSGPDTTVEFQSDSVYIDGQGNAFQIDRIRFFWSDIALLLSNGSSLQPQETISFDYLLESDTLSTTITDDFALFRIESATSTDQLGTVQTSGTVSGLQFRFGLDEPANSALIETVPNSVPFSSDNATLYFNPEQGYAAIRVELFRDTSAADLSPLSLTIFPDELPDQPLILPLSSVVTLSEGQDVRAEVTIDYAAWFGQADVRGDTTLLKQQIVDRLAQSVSLSGVFSD